MKNETMIDPDRLLDAADMLLKALESDQGGNAMIDATYGGAGRGAGLIRDAALKQFTVAELVEAMAMLWRMGLVSQRPDTTDRSVR